MLGTLSACPWLGGASGPIIPEAAGPVTVLINRVENVENIWETFVQYTLVMLSLGNFAVVGLLASIASATLQIVPGGTWTAVS